MRDRFADPLLDFVEVLMHVFYEYVKSGQQVSGCLIFEHFLWACGFGSEFYVCEWFCYGKLMFKALGGLTLLLPLSEIMENSQQIWSVICRMQYSSHEIFWDFD